jgi:microcystin-dependent protein
MNYIIFKNVMYVGLVIKELNMIKKIILALGILNSLNTFAVDKLISSPTGNLILDAGSSSAVKVNKTLQVDSIKNLAGTDILIGLVPTGTVLPYAGSTAPTGWVFAYGQEVSQTGTYANLYSVISNAYCTAEHGGTCTSGNFRLPDMRGRSPFGKDNMGGTAANRITSAKTIDGTTLGKTGGNQNLPSHYHGIGFGADLTATEGSNNVALASGSSTVSGNRNQFDTTGGGHTHPLESINGGIMYGNRGYIGTTGVNRFITEPITTTQEWVEPIKDYHQAASVTHSHSWTGNFSASGSASGTTNIAHTHSTNEFSGRIGLVTGGCDGNSDTCNGLPPAVVLNYIIKL